MTGSQPDDPVSSAQKERVGTGNNRVGMLLDETLEGRIELAFAARVADQELNPDCARGCLHICRLGFRSRVGRINQKTENRSARHQLAQQLKSLSRECLCQKTYPR